MVEPVLTGPHIPVPHFFGTRRDIEGVGDHVRLGSVTAGTSRYPFIAALKQIHSTRVVAVPPTAVSIPLDSPEGDALLTNHPGILLVVRTADCVPILFSELTSKVVGAIHAGWRGTVDGIVEHTFKEAVDRFPLNVSKVRAMIGPSIGLCCYEIDEAVMRPLRQGCKYWEDVLRPSRESHAHLDLKTLIFRKLTDMGIPDDHISLVDHCTACRSDLYYSYRREGRVNGTMMSGIMLPGG